MLSLRKLCLDTIVLNFESFYSVFIDSKDSFLQKYFEFLQRRFSEELATALFESEKLKEKYLEFLINEHLKYLNGFWLLNDHYKNTSEDIFRHLLNLRKICFRSCNDEILKNIVKFCHKIVEIDVRYSNITDVGLGYLSELQNGMLPCPELRKILLRNSFVSDRGVKHLIQHLPLLEYIDYPNTPMLLYRIHEESLAEMNNVHYFNLTELNILELECWDEYTNLLKACLAHCPKLESLQCFIGSDQFQLFTNASLKKVKLSFFWSEENNMLDNFLRMNVSNLTSLSVANCTICVSSLAAHCPVLKEFSATFSNFTDDDDNCQLLMPFLTECSFKRINPLSSKAIGLFISCSPNLKSLSFLSFEIILEMKEQILLWCKNPSAKKIHFTDVHLDIEFLSNILLKCSSLEEMCLIRCMIDIKNPFKVLQNLAKCLPNKPKIDFTDLFDYSK